ncbi:Gfo/Idh/MocA family protein [Paenibacillus sp. UNC499MF]|uniref:Gfo/Idh/MocA family protein n=1 Tax=Paenibacillus sp. UNC499MF TaxID=1502751 RepID=UPI00089FCDFE|nr:Gfo/Idh/MocA family oxidoreductase [Paenibacillus sp. UNC499MF]SEG51324.1 Predicted dehydrogenase [Paenibacillus sp. UNC499MF]
MSTLNRKIRWGILGCASIALRAIVPAIQASATGELAAIASRDGSKARETARLHGIPAAYGSYEELLADPTLDAVYIPLPNHLHFEWTIKAARAGKHVLCEKPLALTAAQAHDMVAACREAGVLLSEAFMYRHHPRYDRIREILAAGELGVIRAMRASFTFDNSADTQNVRCRKEWGGGSLYDIGCYTLSAARYLLGGEPEAVTAHAFFSPGHGGVDMMASGLAEFPDGVALTFDCGMWSAPRNTIEIVGTAGMIEVPSAFVAPEGRGADFTVSVNGVRRTETAPSVNQYVLQIDDFGRAVSGRETYRFPADDAVQGMKVLEACLLSAETRARISI